MTSVKCECFPLYDTGWWAVWTPRIQQEETPTSQKNAVLQASAAACRQPAQSAIRLAGTEQYNAAVHSEMHILACSHCTC